MARRVPELLGADGRVKNDQTITLRVYHAKRRVRGKLVSQCSGGCGDYLIEEEKFDHQCPARLCAFRLQR